MSHYLREKMWRNNFVHVSEIGVIHPLLEGAFERAFYHYKTFDGRLAKIYFSKRWKIVMNRQYTFKKWKNGKGSGYCYKGMVAFERGTVLDSLKSLDYKRKKRNP